MTVVAKKYICVATVHNHHDNRELTQQDGWNTQDDRMTKKCRVRLGVHSLAPH